MGLMHSPLAPYGNRELLFGDIHNHCAISYGHGSLEDALLNAREQLDFCSVTGHAHWPDMPEPNERIQYIIDFHLEGFARLKRNWGKMMHILEDYNDEARFVVFPRRMSRSCRTLAAKSTPSSISNWDGAKEMRNSTGTWSLGCRPEPLTGSSLDSGDAR